MGLFFWSVPPPPHSFHIQHGARCGASIHDLEIKTGAETESYAQPTEPRRHPVCFFPSAYLRSIHVVAYISSSFFLCKLIFHCTYVPNFFSQSPFDEQIFGLFPFWGYYKDKCYKYSWASFCVDICSFLLDKSRKPGSYDRYVFNVLRYCQCQN